MNKSEYRTFIASLFITVLAGYATMLVDAVIGGRFIGEDAVSAVNLLMPVNEIFFSLGLLLGMGANTVAAIAMGRGDIPAVRKHFTVGVVSICFAMAVCLILVLCFRNRIAWLLSAGGPLYDYTLAYLSSIVVFSALGGPFLILKLFTAMTGRPRLVMVCALFELAVNVVCDILFVKALGLGIKGLAYSSIVAILVGIGLLLFYYAKLDNPFRIVKMDCNTFFSTLKSNANYGAGFLASDAVYIVFHFIMNAVVLRFTGESGLFCWSVVIILYFVGYYAVGAAQETCISLGGRYLGVSDYAGFKSIYKRSFVFVSVWMTLVISSVLAFPDIVFPFLGVRSSDAFLTKILLCSIPFIFGNNFISLALVPLIQQGKTIRYIILNSILFISIPVLFSIAHWLVPGKEWMGITCVAAVHLAMIAIRPSGKHPTLPQSFNI